MGRQNGYLYGFNAGVLSKEGLARVDLEAARVAGEVQENLLPRVIGSARMRPGLEYVALTNAGQPCRLLRFVFNLDEKALLEFMPGGFMRVLVNGTLVERPAVTTALSSSWADLDQAGTVSSVGAGLQLTGNGTSRAIRENTLSVDAGQVALEHALRIVVDRGPVYLSVGASSGAEDVLAEQTLGVGIHSIAFVPGTTTIYVRVSSDSPNSGVISAIAFEGAGAMQIPTPYSTMETIREVQYEQSGDVVYLAHVSARQRMVERRSSRSWSLVEYRPEDGPFRLENFGRTAITPNALTGGVTLTASRPLFEPGHAGSIWRLTHGRAYAQASLGAADVWTGPIRVTGLAESERTFSYSVDRTTGSFSGTIWLQRAFGAPISWEDYKEITGDHAGTEEFDDRANEIIYYRIGVKAGGYTSGVAAVSLVYANQSQSGVVFVGQVNSAVEATGYVVTTLGDTLATTRWNEPEWSGARGWPGAVALYDGRLWWGGFDKLYGSVSDAFQSFDDEVEGDAGPVNRNIATGPFDRVLWLAGLQNLLAGNQSQEVSIGSLQFDDPVTPTDFSAVTTSSRGSADGLPALRLDSTVLFVQRNRRRLFELRYLVERQGYSAADLTRFVPEMCQAGIVAMDVQRMPDTRIWCVLEDGTAAVALYEPSEEALAWVPVTLAAGDALEDVAVLPGDVEDEVYFVVRRFVGGGTIRSIERLSLMTDAEGGVINKIMDGCVVYDGAPTALIPGLAHLDGLQVVAWGDGVPIYRQSDNAFVGNGGTLILPAPYSKVVVGRPYTGRFLSVRLNYGAQLGVAVGRPQNIASAFLVARKAGLDGIRIGTSLDNLGPLPRRLNGRPWGANEVVEDLTIDMTPNGGWSRNERIAFSCEAPFPATFLALSVDVETGEGIEARRRS